MIKAVTFDALDDRLVGLLLLLLPGRLRTPAELPGRLPLPLFMTCGGIGRTTLCVAFKDDTAAGGLAADTVVESSALPVSAGTGRLGEQPSSAELDLLCFGGV